MRPPPLLSVENLDITLNHKGERIPLVENFSFTVQKGEILALVGESGCGKSISVLALMGLLADNFTFPQGSIYFNGQNLLTIPKKALRRMRGSELAMIFQEPMTSLHPVHNIGEQLSEMLRTHRRITKKAALNEAVRLLQRVGIPDAAKRVHEYPHQLSGGMRQRVLIAMAISCQPKLLIADEPTTALDVTIQRQVLDLLLELRTEYGMAMILITHDLGVAARMAERVGVMYAGKLVELASAKALFEAPKHPYTQGLIACIPRLDVPARTAKQPLVTIAGAVPAPQARGKGCYFENRCPIRQTSCTETFPPKTQLHAQHSVHCWEYQR